MIEEVWISLGHISLVWFARVYTITANRVEESIVLVGIENKEAPHA